VDKPRILIVEDDLDLSEMLSAYFRVQSYEVLTAAWGSEGLRISQEQQVSLIMLDIRLPDIDGYEICRQLRSNRQTQDTPIIFLTEKRDRVDRLQGLELGVVDYITKPFDIQELRLRVRNAISRAAQQSVSNPVTDLPEGTPVIDHLSELIYREGEWAVLRLSISQLSEFRELYGFVAADDVLRAVALMIRNAVREFGKEDDFIGHLAPEEFAIITNPGAVKSIYERLEARLQQSREYFYPVRDRQKVREGIETDHLRLTSASVDSTAGPFNAVDDLLAALGNTALT
jgi:DNA-binding response OmpR family regulator